jgi:enoyl-CoA hydratase/carnithine racemase
MVSYRFILVEQPSPGVLLITLNRPQQLNALSSGLLGELGSALLAAAEDGAVRAVVLAGNERAFSAGADIKEMVAEGLAAIDNFARAEAQRRIAHFPKALIAAVEGYCLGGGHELALTADIIIAGEKARFGQPEIDIGVIPGDGGTQRIPRVAGKSLAMKICLTGEPIDAQTALAAGLVAEVVPAGKALARALELAAKIAAKAPVAVRLTKQAVLAAFSTTLEQGLEAERQAARLAFTTEDQKEGMAAFVEKRPPRFTGR